MMRLSARYEDRYVAMLERVAARRQLESGVSGFWPVLGRSVVEPCELLVVGRATNGWADMPAGKGPGTLAAFAAAARRCSEKDANGAPCSLDAWLAGFENARRSAFWRVTEAVAADLGRGSGTNWAEQVAWTNIAKVAPTIGWNPSQALWNAQRDGAFELFGLEVEALRPKRMLVLAAWSWFENLAREPWAQGLEFVPGRTPVERVAKSRRTTVVVTPHPMRRARRPIIEGAVTQFATPFDPS